MATVKGVWIFNDKLSLSYAYPNPVYGVEFDSNGKHFYGFKLGYVDQVTYMTNASLQNGMSYYYESKWTDSAYKTVDFGENEQEVSGEFYNWLTANATQVIEITPTTITYNGTETAVSAGQTATMVCAGKKMLTDVVISV